MLGRRARRWWVGIGLVALVTGLAVFFVNQGLAASGQWSSVLALGVSAIMATLTIYDWLDRRGHGAAEASPVARLDALADGLAASVQRQWERAADERKLRQPAPLPIRWTRSAQAVAVPVSAATYAGAAHVPFDPLPGIDRVTENRLQSGDRRDLHDVYGGLPSGRLFLIGAPGAGKTAAAILLLLDALAYRKKAGPTGRHLIPVPVMFTLHDWDPDSTELAEWLVTKITEDVPLFHGRYGRRDLADLLQAGRIAVFLDGLDEISPSVQIQALQALSEQATFRLVVLARSTVLASTAKQQVLVGATALELQPPTPDEVAHYLNSSIPEPAPDAWREVIESLAKNSSGVLGTALRSPLNATLLRDAYGPADPVNRLLDDRRFKEVEDVTNHLLDSAVTTAYRPRPGHTPPRYAEETARRTLGFIARNTHQQRGYDFTWWGIVDWIPLPQRIAISAILGAFTGSLIGLTGGAIYRLVTGNHFVPTTYTWDWFTYSLGSGLIYGFSCGAAMGIASARVRAGWLRITLLNWTIGRLVVAPAVGVITGFVNSITSGIVAGLTVGVVMTLMTFLVIVLVPSALIEYIEGSKNIGGPIGVWKYSGRSSHVLGLVFGVATGLVLWLVLGALLGRWTASLFAGVLILALSLGFGGALMLSTRWRVFVAQTYLALRYRMPLNLISFLEDARSRHLLRTVGPIYQFRHAKLQDRLASTEPYSRQTVGRSFVE